jgi:transposase-like protein
VTFRNLRFARNLRFYRNKRFLTARNLRFARNSQSTKNHKSCFCAHGKGCRGHHLDPGFRPKIKGSGPFRRVHVDFIEMPLSKQGFKYCVTMVCTFSKYLIVVPTRRARATDACKAIIDHLLDVFPNPEVISTDRGSHFTSALNAEFSTMNNVRWKYHVAFRTQSCSLLESRHRELKNITFICAHSFKVDWATIIRRVTFLMNTAENKSTRISPHEVVFCQKPRVGEFDKDIDPPQGRSIPEYMRNRHMITKLIHEKLAICQEKRTRKSVTKNRG